MVDERGRIVSNAQGLMAVSYLACKSYKSGKLGAPSQPNCCYRKTLPTLSYQNDSYSYHA